MGSGKSTLAKALSERYALDLLQSDVMRPQQIEGEDKEHGFNEGKYSFANRALVYDKLIEAAVAALKEGRSVVVDATFSEKELIEGFARSVQPYGKLLFLYCQCPPELAKERISQRILQARSHSEARPELYDQQVEQATWDFDSVPHLVVKTDLPMGEQMTVIESLGA